ncbi:hypothetical protein DRW03_24360 [Corallococcus sp. H22C18031201]|nr:hypothetical protein DRW03_24360 [Corallococcus sp. H22C18031201]
MKVSGDAQKDPKFRKVIEQLEKSARKTRKHPPASQKASEAQKAAVSPPNERSAGAQANQVDAMKSAEAPKAEPNGFLALLRAEIEKVMPKNLDDADKFMKGNETAQVKGAVAGGVQEQKDTAAGPTEQATAAPPDTGAVPARASEAMPVEPAEAQLPVAAGEAMPAPRPDAQVQALQQPKQDATQQMKDADLTPQQLSKANDSRFSSVLSAKANVEKVATAAPSKYTSSEKATLGQAVAKASSDGKAGLGQMAAVKVSGNSKVKTRQLLAKQKDEARRKEVTDTIEKLYQQTKLKVETKLSTLESDVMRMFDVGAEAALSDMKSYANREIDKYKDDRYSGILGKGRWIADLFRDVPEGIKVILRAARTRFGSKMDALAVRISSTVDSRLSDAKAEVNKGQAAIKSYVDSLPRDLQSVGRQAQQEMASRFDELRSGIDAKKDDLAQKLAQKYKEAHDKADAALKKLEDENKGALKGLVDAIAEVIRIIAEFKDKLMGVLRKGADAIMLILKDPIGFLGNLLAAIKQGFHQFVANIWTHLKRGFMKWLFGSLAEAGIQVPNDLDVWSVLKLVLDVLGLTYAWMRGEAVKLVGERNVALIEKLVEYISVTFKGGPQALWEKLKDDLANLKAMVIDAIQTWLIDTIVKQAVAKVVSLFNPAGAFIQAVLAIYNVVMWVIENASRILALIEAIVNSLHAIASGAISGAADWIEQALGNLIPIVIGFLARLIGLGGISAKIREFITKVRTKVRAAVLNWLKKAFEWVKKLFGVSGKKAQDSDSKSAELPAARIKKPVSMAGEGHTVTVNTENGELVITMASSLERRLRPAIGAATTEVQKDTKRSKKQKSEILAVLSKAASDADEKTIKKAWDAEGTGKKRGDLKLRFQQFIDTRLAPVIADLLKLGGLGIKALDAVLAGPPAVRKLPAGYPVRTKLYERGSGWKSARQDFHDSAKKTLVAQVNTYVTTKKKTQVLALIAADLLPAAAEKRYDKGTLDDKYVRKVDHQVDHIRPLAQHWKNGGYKSGDDARWRATIDPTNFQLLTASANASKGGLGHHFGDRPELASTFTSVYAEGGIPNALRIDGKPLLDDKDQPLD